MLRSSAAFALTVLSATACYFPIPSCEEASFTEEVEAGGIDFEGMRDDIRALEAPGEFSVNGERFASCVELCSGRRENSHVASCTAPRYYAGKWTVRCDYLGELCKLPTIIPPLTIR